MNPLLPHSEQQPEFSPDQRGLASEAALTTPAGELNLDAMHELLVGLDSWVEKMKAQNQIEDEALDKIYNSRLPPALYHATTAANARRIATEGLKPSSLMTENTEVVSLSDTISYAKFCASETQGVAPGELVIFEVTVQGLDREEAKSYLLLENPLVPGEKLHEVHYGQPIDPDWLYQLTPAEIVDIELAEK